jgi:hypothetical protein
MRRESLQGKRKRHHTGGPLLGFSSRRRLLHEPMSLSSARGSLAFRRLAYWLNAELQSPFSMPKAWVGAHRHEKGGIMIVGLNHGPEVLVKQSGEEIGRRLFETSIDANRYVEELITREGLDCEYRRVGLSLPNIASEGESGQVKKPRATSRRRGAGHVTARRSVLVGRRAVLMSLGAISAVRFSVKFWPTAPAK